MIRLLADRSGVGLIATAMTLSIPMIVFAQTTESAIEHVPAANKPAVAEAGPTGDDNSTKIDPSVQLIPLTNPAISTEPFAKLWSHGELLRVMG